MSYDDDLAWSYRDESYYNFLKHKYHDRQKLSNEAEEKRKALEKMKDGDPMYHRMAVSAEMAQMRVDMAYLMDKNKQLGDYIETLEYLHQRVGILEGAYGHLKLLYETCKSIGQTAIMQTTIRKKEEPAK